jgi:hypothetical protein
MARGQSRLAHRGGTFAHAWFTLAAIPLPRRRRCPRFQDRNLPKGIPDLIRRRCPRAHPVNAETLPGAYPLNYVTRMTSYGKGQQASYDSRAGQSSMQCTPAPESATQSDVLAIDAAGTSGRGKGRRIEPLCGSEHTSPPDLRIGEQAQLYVPSGCGKARSFESLRLPANTL